MTKQRALTLLLGLGTAAGARPAGLELHFGMISPHDAPDHVDLVVGRPDTLWASADASGIPVDVGWQSGDPTVVAVRRGVLTPLRPGVTTVTARDPGGGAVTVAACVSPSARHELEPLPAGGAYLGSAGAKDARLQLRAVDTTDASIDWGPCVHWYVGAPTGVAAPDTALMSVDRRGLLSFNHRFTRYYVGAAVGTVWPTWVPIQARPGGRKATE
jgi:hypothetical protein